MNAMLLTFAVLIMFQLVGEALSHALALPWPGHLIGMGLLLLWLSINRAAAERLRASCAELLRHLSLLLLPAGVGVIVYAGRIADEWLPIVGALIGGTVTVVVVTALVMRWATRRFVDDRR
jgi:holin-like protein